ncbi:hypothetical protein [Pseudosulfitobacter sp. DSM 107133]|uniref:hypothetical protein n=1 Tax=Pseudosulfitobacter sp. DSM 107133 TaxID=2883100 RepID=UPI001F0805FB|nr:hypothetical protein [Pseudosulfitobacter sp. DSM 107133]UOA26523.1 hypothetical protein DSM107133_01224 [Pseudosulfitobacter sp. DSM 107133]
MISKILSVAAIGATVMLATQAAASVAKPPVGHQGQWWTNPLGCEYSRAGRPGETMWFLIINTAKPGCPTYIAGKTWGGIYREHGKILK